MARKSLLRVAQEKANETSAIGRTRVDPSAPRNERGAWRNYAIGMKYANTKTVRVGGGDRMRELAKMQRGTRQKRGKNGENGTT